MTFQSLGYDVRYVMKRAAAVDSELDTDLPGPSRKILVNQGVRGPWPTIRVRDETLLAQVPGLGTSGSESDPVAYADAKPTGGPRAGRVRRGPSGAVGARPPSLPQTQSVRFNSEPGT